MQATEPLLRAYTTIRFGPTSPRHAVTTLPLQSAPVPRCPPSPPVLASVQERGSPARLRRHEVVALAEADLLLRMAPEQSSAVR